ncbi:MAG: Ig-like domain repeat protein [Halorubrum sp.]|uniref:Ig-like domain repeat protein n=1 Tax=Halorubrum sp. TaxID=1879286 RepID=UPI0039708BFC
MRFSRDRRGQSVVIGTVILFGFLILALSLYQVQVVPQQNGQTEFEHFEEVRNDLVELRAGILQAGSTDRPQYQTVRLGASYSSRLFAINPPDPAGTIRTTESYPITIAYASNGTVIETVPTRFLQYRPGYNELDQSPTWYDASVLYADARDEGGGIAVIEDQELVSEGGEVRIVALQNEFRRSGTGRVTLEFRPAEGVTETLPEDNLTVTVPTRLSEDDWETETDLPTDSDVYDGVSDDANGDGVYNLTLNTTEDDLTVDTVGVQEAPEEPVQNADGAVGGSGGGSDGDDGSGSNDPQVNRFDVTDQSGKQARFDVTWEVSDGGNNLDTVTVELIDQSGTVENDVTTDVSGGTASATDRVSEEGNPNDQTYTIRLTVTDTDGNRTTVTRDVTYSG